ncbi:sulfite exporter TauE/SafE family protein [Thiolapillus sp.]|uniref:sulfite exporter TauE/SafE family protein n=1 Tax=Thiolapillus sp. TaxID=2017437 RepID=UPI003AF44319
MASTEPVKPAKPGKKPGWLKFIVALLAVIVLAVVMVSVRKLSHQFSLPDFDSRLSDGMILIIGLVTGLHCIGMCGGFVISYTARDVGQGRPSFLSHLLYGLGKTLSYAMFGTMFGLNMLGFFKILRHVRIKQPKSLARFASRHQRQSRSPLFIGFFTGFLLGCGPLQAMYVLAAGSSDPLVGAKILTLFGLGTLPALFSFGFLTRWISSQATHRFFQLSGVILIFVGMMMTNKGLIRTQSGYDFQSIKERIMLEMQQMD